MAPVNEYLEALAKIVAIADEIRRNLGAKGEEALRQFEEAVQRNGISFGDMVRAGGGAWGEAVWPPDEPPVVPPVKPPVIPPVTPPIVPPVTPPPTVAFETFTWYAAPIPDDAILKAKFTRGLKWKSQDGDQWAVTPLGGAAMGVDPQGNPAVEVGPIK